MDINKHIRQGSSHASALQPPVFGFQGAEPNWFMVFRVVERHVGTVAALVIFPLNLPLVLLCLVSYTVRIVGADAVYHRFFAHHTFHVGRVTQFVLALIGSQSGQRGPLWWAAKHREHHKHVETTRDPHSPTAHSLMYAAFRWFLDPTHSRTNLDAVPDFARFTELRWINAYYWIPFYGVGAMFFAAGRLGWFGDSVTGVSAFLWGFEVPATIVLYVAAGVNVLNHLPTLPGGYRRFDTPDKSTNRLLLGIVSSGVGFHNNHHRFAACARCGVAWWEIDVSYYFVYALQLLGLAWNVRSGFSDEALAERDAQSLEMNR
jgi:stearoyl-CoA desaturase (Delta-9 desaturase)